MNLPYFSKYWKVWLAFDGWKLSGLLLLCDVFSFVFWKKLKSPKCHFKIIRPLVLDFLSEISLSLLNFLCEIRIYFNSGFPYIFLKICLKPNKQLHIRGGRRSKNIRRRGPTLIDCLFLLLCPFLFRQICGDRAPPHPASSVRAYIFYVLIFYFQY